MTKLARLFVLLAIFASPVVAQDTQAPQEGQAPTASSEPAKVKHTYPTPKQEISGGFTYRTYYGPNASSIGMIGGYGSYEYNFYKWLGLEAEFLGVSGNLKLPVRPPETLHVFTALVGPKIYPFGHHKLDPFGHFDYGAGILATSIPEFAGYPGNSGTKVVHAWQVNRFGIFNGIVACCVIVVTLRNGLNAVPGIFFQLMRG